MNQFLLYTSDTRYKKCPDYVSVNTTLVGYSGINVTGGQTEPNILHPRKYMELILCTQKNTRLDILDPKKYMIGLNCVRTISLAEIRTQKNTRRFFRPPPQKKRLNLQPKKIQELKILDPKKYVGPPRHGYTRVTHLGNTRRFQIPRGSFFVIVCPGDRALVYPGAFDGLAIFDLLLCTTFVRFFCLFGITLKPRIFYDLFWNRALAIGIGTGIRAAFCLKLRLHF